MATLPHPACVLLLLVSLAPASAARASVRRKQALQLRGEELPITTDGYEPGDQESQAGDADAADLSVSQFMAEDNALDGPSAAEVDDGSVALAQARAAAAEEGLDSEEPSDSSDSFAQTSASLRRAATGATTHRQHGTAFQVRRLTGEGQFLLANRTQNGSSGTHDIADASTGIARVKRITTEEGFNRENTIGSFNSSMQNVRPPHRNRTNRRAHYISLVQSKQEPDDEYEYSSEEPQESDTGIADYSLYESPEDDDDFRDSSRIEGDTEETAAMAAQDGFSTENMPDGTDSYVQTDRRASAVHWQAGR